MKTIPSDAPKARVASIRTTTRSKAFMVGTTGTTRSQTGADDDSRHVTATGGQWTVDSGATADRAKATARAYRQCRHRGLDTVPAAREAAVVLNGWQLLRLRPGGWKGGRLVLGKLAAHCLFSSSPSHRLAPALNTALSLPIHVVGGWGGGGGVEGWGRGLTSMSPYLDTAPRCQSACRCVSTWKRHCDVERGPGRRHGRTASRPDGTQRLLCHGAFTPSQPHRLTSGPSHAIVSYYTLQNSSNICRPFPEVVNFNYN